MRLVGIRHLKQATAAHQTPVRHGEDLQRGEGDEDDRRNRGQTEKAAEKLWMRREGRETLASADSREKIF